MRIPCLDRERGQLVANEQPVNDGTPTEDLHDIDTRNEWGCLLPSEKATTSQSTNHSQIIFADNQGAIKLSENPRHHSRSKHIDVKFHFIREASCKHHPPAVLRGVVGSVTPSVRRKLDRLL